MHCLLPGESTKTWATLTQKVVFRIAAAAAASNLTKMHQWKLFLVLPLFVHVKRKKEATRKFFVVQNNNRIIRRFVCSCVFLARRTPKCNFCTGSDERSGQEQINFFWNLPHSMLLATRNYIIAWAKYIQKTYYNWNKQIP